ncbi:MAG: DUF99 family protein [Desulfurococcales archaeon]|nr:DUF99 family protein [Desulfurococcales archaeon]
MPCIIACDDGYVSKVGTAEKGFTLVGCMLYKDLTPLDIGFSILRVDGLNASSIISGLAISLMEDREKCVNEKPIVLLDTIIFAGFNIVSIGLIKYLTEMDVVAFYPYKPNTGLLVETVAKHLDFPYLRSKLIKNQLKKLIELNTNKGTSYIVSTISDKSLIKRLIEFYQVYTRSLEPLRAIHMITSSLSRLFC